MALVRVALFDPRLPEPVVGEVQASDEELAARRDSEPRIAITSGTDDVCGTVIVPLGALMVLVRQLTGEAERAAGPGIIMPPSGIIKPN